jgi:hypothetical protein
VAHGRKHDYVRVKVRVGHAGLVWIPAASELPRPGTLSCDGSRDMSDLPSIPPSPDLQPREPCPVDSLVIYVSSQGFFLATVGDDRTPSALKRRVSAFYSTRGDAEHALAVRRSPDAPVSDAPADR